jgi:hypothetical protein
MIVFIVDRCSFQPRLSTWIPDYLAFSFCSSYVIMLSNMLLSLCVDDVTSVVNRLLNSSTVHLKSALNGMEALKRILEEDLSANVVICSALEQQALIEETLRLGAKDFIAKPIMTERILDALFKYC